MKTRNIGTTVISALLFIIAGCQVEQVVPNLREHTINAVIDDGETKVRLVQGNDSPNLFCRWDGDEYIYVYYKMIDKYNEESPQVQVKEVSTDGRSAKFTYSVPSSWDDHDTYEVKCFTSICHPTVVDDSIYVDASLKRESIDHFRDYIYAEGEIDKSSTLEAPFHHYYTYELLHVSNTSGSEIRFAEVGFEGKYWYKTQGSICIDDGRFVPLGPASQKPYEKSDEISIKPGEEGIIVSAYIPNGLKINDATLVSIIDDKSVKTSNKKSSDVNLEQGHAYHLYVEWDGKELRFVNAPSEEDEKPQVETHAPSDITSEGVVLSGMFKPVPGSRFDEIGFCYSGTSNPPTLLDSCAIVPDDSGSVSIFGLRPLQTYYVSAYAVAGDSVFYGNVISFTTLEDENGGLVDNGDFTGGSYGFESDYVYQESTGSRALWDEGKFAIGTSPSNYHRDFISHGDHTTGTGNMLIVNGSPDNSKYVWKKKFNVTAGRVYEFSAWFISVSVGSKLDKESIEYNIDGITNVGEYDQTEDEWERYFGLYTATESKEIEIKIRTKSTALGGNDFAIDDIYFMYLNSFDE